MRFCDVRFCFRQSRLPVPGTIWHACYKHHPTSPLRPPMLNEMHKDFCDNNPDYEQQRVVAVSNTSIETSIDESEADNESIPFGFFQG